MWCVLMTLSCIGLSTAKEDDDRVHDLMEKVHEGKKSPWRTTRRAVENDPVDWTAIQAALPKFSAMCEALKTAKQAEVRDSADGYVDGAKALHAAAVKRDAAAARAAVKRLADSCADCHFKGGPGGKLD